MRAGKDRQNSLFVAGRHLLQNEKALKLSAFRTKNQWVTREKRQTVALDRHNARSLRGFKARAFAAPRQATRDSPRPQESGIVSDRLTGVLRRAALEAARSRWMP